MKYLMASYALLIYTGFLLIQTDSNEVQSCTYNGYSDLTAQDTITVYRSFEAKLEMLSKEAGGRQTAFFNNFQPLFKFGEVKVFGTIDLPRSIQMVRPGDKKEVSIKLSSSVELKTGQQFEIFELNKKIGKGTVLKLNK